MGAADRGPWRRVAATAVLSGLIIGALWAVTVSPLFRLEALAISGQSHLSSERVAKLAQVHEGTTNVLWLSAGRVVERLEADPWVASATADKELPSGLTISVTERIPVLTAGQRGAWSLIARDGVVVDVVKADPGLPATTGVTGIAPGGRVGADPADAAEAAGFLAAAGALDRVETITTDREGGMRIVLTDGGKVTVGPPEDLREKMEAVAGIVGWAEERGSKIRTIDVTAPGAPAAKVTKGSPPLGEEPA